MFIVQNSHHQIATASGWPGLQLKPKKKYIDTTKLGCKGRQKKIMSKSYMKFELKEKMINFENHTNFDNVFTSLQLSSQN